MTQHAVVHLDHHQAQVLQFDKEHVESSKVKEHKHHTKQHGSAVRSEHEFFGHVCDALQGIPEVLIAGTSTACTDFKHYVEKHRPACTKQIVGYETVDHPTDNQLVAMARKYFMKYDQLHGKDPAQQ